MMIKMIRNHTKRDSLLCLENGNCFNKFAYSNQKLCILGIPKMNTRHLILIYLNLKETGVFPHTCLTANSLLYVIMII